MDQRQVFSNNQELLSILENLYHHRQRASLLVDHEGLTRWEGTIISIKRKENIACTLLTMEGGREIELSQVMAVNGLFRSDYSEC